MLNLSIIKNYFFKALLVVIIFSVLGIGPYLYSKPRTVDNLNTYEIVETVWVPTTDYTLVSEKNIDRYENRYTHEDFQTYMDPSKEVFLWIEKGTFPNTKRLVFAQNLVADIWIWTTHEFQIHLMKDPDESLLNLTPDVDISLDSMSGDQLVLQIQENPSYSNLSNGVIMGILFELFVLLVVVVLLLLL